MMVNLLYIAHTKLHVPLVNIGLVAIDLLFHMVIIYFLTQQGLMILSILVVYQTNIYKHFIKLNQTMYKLIQQFCCKKLNYSSFIFKANKCRIIHACLINEILKKKKKFFSQIIGVTVAVNFPINAYFIVYILNRRTDVDSNIAPILIILVFQFAALIFCMTPFAYITKKLHQMKSYVTPTQLILHSQSQTTLLKWKFLFQYEIVNNYKQISISYGPFGSITNLALFEVS